MYPWANVIGSDLVPPALIAKDKVPSNCRFEIDDANLPLEHYSQTFSLVHARALSRGLNDAHSFFYQVARTLKPGGVFLMVHGDLQMRDENLLPLPFVEPGEPRFTWLQYICGQVQNAWRNRGGFTHHLWWKEWLESNPNYSEVRQKDLDIPIGAWKEGMSDQESVAANLMKENIYNVLESWRRLILGDGHRAEDVNRWIEECKTELKNLRVHYHIRFIYFVAVRSNTPWQDRGDWTPPDETTREIIKEA